MKIKELKKIKIHMLTIDSKSSTNLLVCIYTKKYNLQLATIFFDTWWYFGISLVQRLKITLAVVGLAQVSSFH